MILIRADANEKIGTGHVMRCIAIARAVERRGQQACFVTADESAAPILEEKGQRYRILHTDYRNMEEELPALRRLLAEEEPDFFLADSYFATPRYLREVRRSVPVGILDDKALAGMPVDLLVNYNIFADASLYRPDACGLGGVCGRYPEGTDRLGGACGRYPKGTDRLGDACGGNLEGADMPGEYLLGTGYVPLRGEFERVEYSVREKAEKVLVTTGGSDRYNIAGRLLRRALADPAAGGLCYLVVSGAYNVHLPELKELEEAHGNVSLFSNVSNMSGLMRASDIAVSAGGSTLYELSAVGVPFVCFSFVDNQERIVRGFVEKGLTCFGGDYLRQGEAMLDGVVDSINRLAADPGLRRSFSGRLKSVVDGRGAMRIAERLCAIRRRGQDAGNRNKTQNDR